MRYGETAADFSIVLESEIIQCHIIKKKKKNEERKSKDKRKGPAKQTEIGPWQMEACNLTLCEWGLENIQRSMKTIEENEGM